MTAWPCLSPPTCGTHKLPKSRGKLGKNLQPIVFIFSLFFALISDVQVRPHLIDRFQWLPVRPENFSEFFQGRCFLAVVAMKMNLSACMHMCVCACACPYVHVGCFHLHASFYGVWDCLCLLLCLSRLMSRLRSCCRKPGLGKMSLCGLTAATASRSVRPSKIIRKASTSVAERLTPIRQ